MADRNRLDYRGNLAGTDLLPIKPGSCTKPVPGFDVRIFDDHGAEMNSGRTGSVVIRLPLPPGCLTTLWNNDRDYIKTYLSEYLDYYLTGDAGFFDDDGYLWIMGRTDDIINTAGHRLSTGAIEEVLASHPDIAECAVTGVDNEVKGEIPVGFIVLKTGVSKDKREISTDLIQMVREKIGPIASFKVVVVVKHLPKTRSGKILRGTLKKIATGADYRVPGTIDDPATLDEIRKSLAVIGYPRKKV